MSPCEPFPCGECGGRVVLASARGKLWYLGHGVSVPIPEDIMVMRCQRCGDMYLGGREPELIGEAVRAALTSSA